MPPGNYAIILVPDLNEEHARLCHLLIGENRSYHLEVIAITTSLVILVGFTLVSQHEMYVFREKLTEKTPFSDSPIIFWSILKAFFFIIIQF